MSGNPVDEIFLDDSRNGSWIPSDPAAIF